jgi:transducin (beta)-like 1
MLQITAEEINFILYQYLQESGFSHSAYTFGKECNIIENKFRHFHIPAGMLIIFLEKALSLIHIETHFNDGDDMIVCNEPFTLLNPHHCSTVSTIKKTGALNQSSIAQNPLDSIMGAAANAEHKVSFGLINLQETKEYDQEMQDESKHAEYDAAGSLMSKNKGEIVHGASSVRQTALLQDSGSKLKILQSNSDTSVKVAWNPKNHMLAFGGDNACAYLWNMDDNLEKATKISSLPHLRPEMPNSTVSIEQSTVTTVNWKPDGKIFVTGASDGILRLWDQNGDLGAIMMNDASIPAKSKDHVGNDGFATNGTNESAGHNKADQGSFDTIYDAKWNKDGSNLVTVSEKNNVILWNNEGKLRASYQGHTDSVVGIDWKNNNNFATASQDGIIKVWDVQSSQSMKTYNAHDGAVK